MPNYSKKVIIQVICLLSILLWMNYVPSSVMFKDSNLPVPDSISPWNWDADCRGMGDSDSPLPVPCTYNFLGDKEGFQVLLIGDSHAASVSQALVEKGSSVPANIHVFTHTACPFVELDRNLKQSLFTNLVDESCLRHNDKIFKVVESGIFDFVIYMGRSSVPYIAKDGLSARNNFVNEVLSNLRRVQELSGKVYVIGITPEYEPASTLTQRLFGAKGTFSSRALQDDQSFYRLSPKYGISYIKVYELFCKLGRCVNKFGDKYLFHDATHLSYFGSNLVIEELFKSLQTDLDKANI